MRYMCLVCDEDYLLHQTIIEDSRGRCVCLNCWDAIKFLKKKNSGVKK